MCNCSNKTGNNKQVNEHTHDNYMYHACVLGYDVYFTSMEDKEAAVDGVIKEKEAEIDDIVKRTGEEIFALRRDAINDPVEHARQEMRVHADMLARFDRDLRHIQELSAQIEQLKAQLPKYTIEKLKRWVPNKTSKI